MAYSALTNSNGVIEFRRIPNGFTIADMNDGFDQGLEVEDVDLPDEEYQEFWEIVDGALVIGDGVLTKLKDTLKVEIDLEFVTKSKENIIVSGNEYQVSENMLLTLSTLTYPVDWILADNTTIQLTQTMANDIIASITSRVSSLKLDARRKKDLVLAMTTQAQLEAVDITAL